MLEDPDVVKATMKIQGKYKSQQEKSRNKVEGSKILEEQRLKKAEHQANKLAEAQKKKHIVKEEEEVDPKMLEDPDIVKATMKIQGKYKS